ncbi:MAG TPA: pentapeptide repeat-containing protein [Nitrososphaera sp.]|nr:pentapeptide repeat-containing protein [Nitrososphaera sp.]
MARLAGFWKKIAAGWTVQRIAAVLIVVSVVVFVAGVLNKHCACVGWPNLGDTLNDIISDFYANVSVDCLSIAFAILVIDRLNERRVEAQENAQLKAQLIREMGSADNGIAIRAIREMESHGNEIVNWTTDGSLRKAELRRANLFKAILVGADLIGARLSSANLQEAFLMSANLQHAWLSHACLREARLGNTNLQESRLTRADLQEAWLPGANLKGANLEEANLRGANLYGVNLEGAVLTERQLVTVTCLVDAKLVNGKKYDGRYRLVGDFYPHNIESYEGTYGHGLIAVKTGRPGVAIPRTTEDKARWYGVTVEEYLAGQEWAREHLADLRREAGLDPDTGLPVEPTNGVEPQPAEPPARPAARRNHYRRKSSMVAHRGRW